MMPSILGSTVLHGGVPGDYDPQAAFTGGMVGVAVFLIFVLGMILWNLLNRYWLRPRESMEAELASQGSAGYTEGEQPTAVRPASSNMILVNVAVDEGTLHRPTLGDEEEQRD